MMFGKLKGSSEQVGRMSGNVGYGVSRYVAILNSGD